MIPSAPFHIAVAQTISDTLVRTLIIGDERPDYAFSYIWDMAVDHQSRVFVLDRGSGNVRLFDANGRFLRALGGKGSGPGEFQLATQLGFAGDSLWLVDSRL